MKGIIQMSDVNNKSVAEIKDINISIKELLDLLDKINALSFSIEKSDFIFCAMQREISDVSQIEDKNEELYARSLAFNNISQWCNIFNDYIIQSSKQIKSLSADYKKIYNKFRGVMQNA